MMEVGRDKVMVTTGWRGREEGGRDYEGREGGREGDMKER